MSIEVESARYIGSEGDVSITVRLSNGKSGESFVFLVPVRFYKSSGIVPGELDEERFEELAAEAERRGVLPDEVAWRLENGFLLRLCGSYPEYFDVKLERA